MKRNFSRLNDEEFDLLVIGGGIYGAWTAYDAALRGLKVALVEKNDWASGTSSMSSKLIHGGLRYLQYGRVGLVRKSLRERRRLLQLAPHRVHALRFLAPLYRKGGLGRRRLKFGLWAYDRLAGRNDPLPRHEYLNPKRLSRNHAYLEALRLRCGYAYSDAQTDDARFTLEIVDGAVESGAVAVNHACAETLLTSRNEVDGARIRDCIGGSEATVRARATVLCAGPWSSRLLPGGSASRRVRYRMSKGVHLSMPPLGTDHALLLPANEKGRVVFLLPWYGRTLLGTTDTDFDGNPNRVSVEPSDVNELLTTANQALSTKWTVADIGARWAGVRTLLHSGEAQSAAASRDFQLTEPMRRLLVPIGGKFSSARIDAATVVDRAVRRVGGSRPVAVTGREPFPWAPSGHYRSWLRETTVRGLGLGLDEVMVLNCQQRYGVHVNRVYDLIDAHCGLEQRIVPDLPFCFAELVHAARSEMVETLEDVLQRRIPLRLLTRLDPSTVQTCAQLVGEQKRWSDERRQREVDKYVGAYAGSGRSRLRTAHESA